MEKSIIIFDDDRVFAALCRAEAAAETLFFVNDERLLDLALRSFCRAVLCAQRTADAFFFVDIDSLYFFMTVRGNDRAVRTDILALSAAETLFRVDRIFAFFGIDGRGNIVKTHKRTRAAAETFIFYDPECHISCPPYASAAGSGREKPYLVAVREFSALFRAAFAVDIDDRVAE